MSVFSAWSYTSTVTFWEPVLDEYSQPSSWTRVTFSASYTAGGRLAVDSMGEEFVPDLTVHLEAAAADAPRNGWRMKVGDVADATPPDDSRTVRQVRTFDPSTFNEGLPDHEVLAA